MKKRATNRIFLIGPMGAGKSTVGKHLAERLSLTFYDSDEEVEKSTGAKIDWIFDLEGEAGFRKRESRILQELTSLPNIVLATGGGSILALNNRHLLKSRGIVVYLQASLDEQHERTRKGGRRPLLQVNDRREVLRKLHLEREPIYLTLADLTMRTHKWTTRFVVDNLIGLLQEHFQINTSMDVEA